MNPTDAAPADLGGLYRRLRDRLRAARGGTPDLDARVLAAAAAGVASEDVLLRPERAVTREEWGRAEAFLLKRLAGAPVGRIIGEREFWGLSFVLSSETLEPRPDTETLVEKAIAWCEANGGRDHAWCFADLGTGSGAIAVALLSELPRATAVAVDVSEGALFTAVSNARRHGVDMRMLPCRGDFTGALAEGLDFIVSNPPYIPSATVATLDVEVKSFDPMAALDGGPDGLDAFRALIGESWQRLRCGGALLVEIGADQGDNVSQLLALAGFENITIFQDIGGRDRVAAAMRPL